MDQGELPISVVIPHMASRDWFLHKEVLPSVFRNRPSQITINAGFESAQRKRNNGAKGSTQPFLFFCDDDVVLREGCLSRMYLLLLANPTAGFCYCDFERVIHPGIEFPYKGGTCVVGPDALGRLNRESPIPTMSLIRREAFPGFDEEIEREQDRDLYLAIRKAGWTGVYIPSVLIELHQIDDRSITQNVDQWKWHTHINKKYGISG